LVANYEGIYPLNERQLHEWAVLDTFDMLSPTYDRRRTARTLRSWFQRAGFEDVEVAKIHHLVGRGRRPGAASAEPSRLGAAAQPTATHASAVSRKE
jgi:hypothetical protein